MWILAWNGQNFLRFPQIHDNLVHILPKETEKRLRKSTIYVVIVKAKLEKLLVAQNPLETNVSCFSVLESW